MFFFFWGGGWWGVVFGFLVVIVTVPVDCLLFTIPTRKPLQRSTHLQIDMLAIEFDIILFKKRTTNALLW